MIENTFEAVALWPGGGLIILPLTTSDVIGFEATPFFVASHQGTVKLSDLVYLTFLHPLL